MMEFEHGQLTPWGYIMDAEALAEVQFRQGLSTPVDLGGDVEVGGIAVAVLRLFLNPRLRQVLL